MIDILDPRARACFTCVCVLLLSTITPLNCPLSSSVDKSVGSVALDTTDPTDRKMMLEGGFLFGKFNLVDSSFDNRYYLFHSNFWFIIERDVDDFKVIGIFDNSFLAYQMFDKLLGGV